jgi:hypothetical protein
MNNTFYPTNDYRNYLAHYGVKGMKWGVRKFQNADGSLNSAGKRKVPGKGLVARTKIRLQSGRVRRKELGLQWADSKGFLQKTSALLGAGRLAAIGRANSYQQARLAAASKTKLGKHRHNVKAFNRLHASDDWQRLHEAKGLGNALAAATSNSQRKTWSGRTRTVGGTHVLNKFGPKHAGLALDVAYLAAGGEKGVQNLKRKADSTARKVSDKYLGKGKYDRSKAKANRFKNRHKKAYSWATGQYD